jgi:hypothetical protein
MQLHPTSFDGAHSGSKADTSRSWRVLKNLFPLFMAGLVAIVVFFNQYYALTSGLASSSAVAAFEKCLRDLIREANSKNTILPQPSDGYSWSITPPNGMVKEVKELEDAVRGLGYDNKDLAEAAVKYAFDEYNAGKGSKRQEYTLEELMLLENRGAWKTYDSMQVILSALGTSIVWLACTFIVCWLLVIILAFIWWFLLDRLRDISKAIRGS